MSLKTVIGLSTIFITAYCISVLVNHLPLALLLISLSPIVLIWLVYRTLTDNYQSDKTFEERFYEDSEYERNVTDR